MNRVLGASLLAAIAVAAGLGIAHAGDRAGPACLSIAGVIRDEQGRPIPRVWIEVEGYPKPLQSPPAWDSDVHGRFQIDDVPHGPVKLLVTTGDWSTHAKKKVVETRAGVRDLVIVLDPGPQLLLRIVDYLPGPQERGARVTWEEPDGKRDWRWTPIRDDGWARFVALPPDRELEVWAEAEINLRHVRARGLKPGQTEQRIERHEVKDIAGKVRGSQALRERLDVHVYAHPSFLVARAALLTDGSFRVHGLPPGTYVVGLESFGDKLGPLPRRRVEAGTTDLVIDFE